MAAYGNSRDREVERLRDWVVRLESEVNELKQEVKRLAVKMESAKIPMEVTNSVVTEQSQTVKPILPQANNPIPVPAPDPEKNSPNFYLSTPNSDGSFNNSSANTSYKEGASIYKFQKIEDNRARFKIDEHEASVRMALLYPDKNIDPACDALNAFDPKARRIATDKNGIAELIGDKWKVTTKARIRYES